MQDPFYREDLPSHVKPELVYDFNIYDPAFEDFDPFLAIKQLHDMGLPEIFWTRHNGGHWVALSGNAIAAIFKDPTHFSSSRMFVLDQPNFDSTFFIPLMADPPKHTSYRKVAAAAFSPQRIAGMLDETRTLTASLIGALRPRGSCEFMADFSLQMPIIIVLKLLGLPLEDRPRLVDISDKVIRPQAGLRDEGLQLVYEYLTPIVEQRRANPGTDVISAVTQATIDGEPMAPEAALGTAVVLLTGGLDTVSASLGHMMRHLAENPEQRRTLAADSSRIHDAAEEMVRRFGPTTQGRVLKSDLAFRGVTLRSGDIVVWAAAMYNLDKQIFSDPLKVDFGRQKASHMSFGSGIHFCLGAMLARQEFRIFLEEWLSRIPDFRVVPGAKVRYRPGIIISLRELPLQWDV